MTPVRIAIFASGNGSNAEAIIRHFKDHPQIKVALLLSNNPGAYALERSANLGIPAKTFDRQTFRETEQVLTWLRDAGITHIVLAGFLWLIPAYILRHYEGKIINIHPSLLPKYGGKGMYGMKVHEAVKVARDTESGITIHLVDARYDEGRVVFQANCVVEAEDSPEEIAAKIHKLEHHHFPLVIEKWLMDWIQQQEK